MLRALSFLLLAATAFNGTAFARPIAFAADPPRESALVVVLGTADDLAARVPALDAASRATVRRALAAASFRFRDSDTLALHGVGPWNRVVVVGAGTGPVDAARLQDIGGLAARETANHAGPVALLTSGLGADADTAVQLAIGGGLGNYRFERYKSPDPAQPRPAGRDAPLTIITADPRAAAAAYARAGEPLVEAVTFARDLVTEPANVLHPESFVERTREAFQGLRGVTITVLDVPAMEQLGMHAILSVGQGSVRPARMLIVEYRGPSSPERPVALVGKGVTFDTGGISIKPAAGMWRMKSDMSGAAAVIATALAHAKAQTPVHLVAIAGLVENMTSGAAARPGDVVRAHNGRTIERFNTDAEGRVVLADAVAYAESRYRPAAIVDVATLTGAVRTALGPEYAGLFSRDDALAQQLLAAGEATGEELWRLPLHRAYAERLQSPIADIRDIAEEEGAGAGIGAHFIGFFVTPHTPWAHIDIAGTAWSMKGKPTAPAGAVGFPVRLLHRFVTDFQGTAR